MDVMKRETRSRRERLHAKQRKNAINIFTSIKLNKTEYNMLRLLISFIYLVILHFSLVNLIFVVAIKCNSIFGIYLS